MESTLKIINERCEELVRELFVDCERVECFRGADQRVRLAAAFGRRLSVAEVYNGLKVQMVEFVEDVVEVACKAGGIHMLLKDGSVEFVDLQMNQTNIVMKWLPGDEEPCTMAVLQGATIICTSSKASTLNLYCVKGPNHVEKIARIDCFSTSSAPCLTCSPDGTTLFIGTADGHVYEWHDGSFALIHDLNQPVKSIHWQSGQLIIIGSYGKIVKSDHSSRERILAFLPSDVMSGQVLGDHVHVLCDGDLYSVRLPSSADGGLPGGVEHCPVKFIRAFYIQEECQVVLSETGAVYEIHGRGLSKADYAAPVLTRDAKTILQDIHDCIDKTKLLSQVSEKVGKDLQQLSSAIHLLDLKGEQFKFRVVSFNEGSAPFRQVLRVVITNGTDHQLSRSHWAVQVSFSAGPGMLETCCDYKQDWEPGADFEIVHTVDLQGGLRFGLNISIVYRSGRGQACILPVGSKELGVMNFLQPIGASTFDEMLQRGPLGVTAVVGVVVGSGIECKEQLWRRILNDCWHRGFANYGVGASQVLACYGDVPVRFTADEASGGKRVWVVRVFAGSHEVVRDIRAAVVEIFAGEQAVDCVKVADSLLVDLQNIERKLHYLIGSADHDGELDVTPLVNELDRLLAENLPIM